MSVVFAAGISMVRLATRFCFGADQLLPVDDEERLGGAVLDREFGHATALGYLPDGGQTLPQPLFEKEVREGAGPVGSQREYGQSTVCRRFREFQAGERALDVLHLAPPYVGSNDQLLNSIG